MLNRKIWIVCIVLFLLNCINGIEVKESLPEHIFSASEKYKIVGIGESNDHFTRNNFEILQDTLKLFSAKYPVTYLFLEYSESDQPFIDDFLKSGDEKILLRNSESVLFLMQKIYELNSLNQGKIIPIASEKNIDFHTYRKFMEGVAERDRSVYEKICSVRGTLGENERILIYYGSAHTSKDLNKEVKKSHLENISDLLARFKTIGELISADPRYKSEYYTFTLSDTMSNYWYPAAMQKVRKYIRQEIMNLYNTTELVTNPVYYGKFEIKHENGIDELLVYDGLKIQNYFDEYCKNYDRFAYYLDKLKMLIDQKSNYIWIRDKKSEYQMILSRISGEMKLFDDFNEGYEYYRNWYEVNKGKLYNATSTEIDAEEFIWRCKFYLLALNLFKKEFGKQYSELNCYFLKFIFQEKGINDSDQDAIVSELKKEMGEVLPLFKDGLSESYQVSLIRYLDDKKYNVSDLRKEYKAIYKKNSLFIKEVK